MQICTGAYTLTVRPLCWAALITMVPVRATKNSQSVIDASQPGRLIVLLNLEFHLSVLQ